MVSLYRYRQWQLWYRYLFSNVLLIIHTTYFCYELLLILIYSFIKCKLIHYVVIPEKRLSGELKIVVILADYFAKLQNYFFVEKKVLPLAYSVSSTNIFTNICPNTIQWKKMSKFNWGFHISDFFINNLCDTVNGNINSIFAPISL